ncbi:MAG: type II toxin-antitoxin system YoeB family toxin [Halothiobacillaceae bacterium]|nr:type II toxin-antitoxin system YoeB family toxin [Halothiobacillaceae bacterium]
MHQKDRNPHDAARKIIRELIRSDAPAMGTGKPDPRRHNLTGLWSRRLSRRDRNIYRFDDTSICLFALGGQYDSV